MAVFPYMAILPYLWSSAHQVNNHCICANLFFQHPLFGKYCGQKIIQMCVSRMKWLYAALLNLVKSFPGDHVIAMTTPERKHIFGSPYECHVYDLDSVEVVGSPKGIVGRTYNFEGTSGSRSCLLSSKVWLISEILGGIMYGELCKICCIRVFKMNVM